MLGSGLAMMIYPYFIAGPVMISSIAGALALAVRQGI